MDEDEMQPAHMRGYFERKVPLGAAPRILTYMSYLGARMWELSETGQTSELATLISLAAVFCEQVAIDGGRGQVAWLLTGLQTPAFNLTQRNTQRLQEEPFAALADPRWMAAQLAYLKDLDWFVQRQAARRSFQRGRCRLGGRFSRSPLGGHAAGLGSGRRPSQHLAFQMATERGLIWREREREREIKRGRYR